MHLTPMVFVAVSLVLSLLAMLAGLAMRAALWRRGTESGGFRPLALLDIPRRYLVDVHNVVSRDRATARMHAASAGGMLGLLLLVFLRYVSDIQNNVIDWLLTVAALSFLGGSVSFALRRIFHSKARTGQLSGGRWRRFSLWLSCAALGLFVLHINYAFGLLRGAEWPAAILAGVSLAVLIGPAGWSGTLRHGLAGGINLAFHRRPSRFGAKARSVALFSPAAGADQIGVAEPKDFSWNQLLSFDACVECGRCEVACPAFAAGQPLNPKALIQDLVTSMVEGPVNRTSKPDENMLDSERANRPALIADETLWSCTTCRACVEECPMMIEHVDAVVDLRRFLVCEEGALDGAAARTLVDLRMTDTRSGRPLGERFEWATDLDIPRAAADLPFDVLLWAGESAFDLRGQRSLRALVKLLHEAEVDFAVLGDEEADIGDLARRLGDEPTFTALFNRNVHTLERYSFNRIVTPDPHVLQCLGEEYAALGSHWRVIHHSQLLDELIADNRLNIRQPSGATITYHDPCYLGRYMGEYDAPRRVLSAIGASVSEMERSRSRSRCCGGGGGAALIDVPGKRRIPDMRMQDAAETGTATVAVACPQCAIMLEGVAAPRPVVADIAELVHDAVFAR